MTVTIPAWEPPWPSRGAPGFVRVTSTMVRGAGCAEQVARKARPDLYPVQDAPREPTPPGSFPLGLVRDAVLRVLESTGRDRGGEPDRPVREIVEEVVAESWQEWSAEVLSAVEAGVVGYLEVLASLRSAGELPATLVVSDVVAVQDPDGDRVEFWGWAVHHISRDGLVREVHLLRWHGAGGIVPGPAESALLAHVAAAGFIAEHARWYQRFVPVRAVTQPPAAQQVRVRVVGVLDGVTQICFDGSAEEASAAFEQQVPGSLGALGGGRLRTSRGCASCNVRHVCPGLPAYPGLLGVAGFSPTLRAVSPSDLWTHGACPRQLHLLRDLGLPRERQEPSDALRRGVQVHAWLAHAHERGVACTAADVPESYDDVPEHVGILGWTPSDYAANRPYLLQHLRVCPLAHDGRHALRSEIDITALDPEANVLFSTRPDAAYLDHDGAWVIREVKTVSPRGLSDDRTALLHRYPQVAATVCLLADGYRPDTQPADHAGRVELELLGPDAGDVLVFDAADPLTVLVARSALAERIDAWLFDTTHPIGDRPPCHSCEVSRWCGQQPASDVTVTDLLGDEVSASLTAPAQATDAVLRDILGVPDDDEEFPF